MKSFTHHLLNIPNSTIFQIACTHKSVNGCVGQNYERLEFLGDSFLQFLMAYTLLKKHNCKNIEFLLPPLVANETISVWAQKSGLSRLIKAGYKIGSKSKVNADVFESYLGCWSLHLFQKGPTKKIDNYIYKNFVDNWSPLVNMISKFIDDSRYKERINIERKKSLSPQKIVAKQNKIIGYSIVKFEISLALYYKSNNLTEGELTTLRKNIYSSSRYGNLIKTNLNYVSKVNDSSKSPFYNQIGGYMREAKDTKEFFKRWQVIRHLVQKSLFKC